MNLDSSSDSRVSLRAKFRNATREAILDAAAAVLSPGDAAQARIEDIASRAGVAVGTVYNYFQDRRALVSALLETRKKTLMDALDASLKTAARTRRTAASPRDAFETELTHFVAAVASHIDANRFLLNLLLEDERSSGIDAQAASRRRTVQSELLARAERLMKRGIRSRALRKDDAAMYAALLVGMVRGIAISSLTLQNEFSAGATASIVRVFMTGAAR
jgi:AcrR family transcriptional regulator